MSTENNTDHCDSNMADISGMLKKGLERLEQEYEIKEVDAGDMGKFTVHGMVHRVKQYDVKGVGNLLIMFNPLQGAMQVDTFTLTPYFKNLPLLSTDYMCIGDKKMFLMEIDSLVPCQDERYTEYIRRFAENSRLTEHLQDMPLRPGWYDDIRAVVIAKQAAPDDDELIIRQFLKNLDTFIEMEKASPALDEEARHEKWKCNAEYARRLVEEGGVSTDLFVQSLGAERTKKFFDSVFFAPDRYAP